MHDLRGDESESRFSETNNALSRIDINLDNARKQRCKPGPKPKLSPRTQKESCRLSEEEDTQFRQVCKERKIKPADYLRECCLAAAYIPATADKTQMVADIFMRLHELETITGQIKQSGEDSPKKSAEKIAALNSRIIAIRKTLKATFYAGALVLAASFAHVDAGRDDMIEILNQLRKGLPVGMFIAVCFGCCLGVLAEKLSNAGYFSLAPVRNCFRRLRNNR